jgi:hypothetical protein
MRGAYGEVGNVVLPFAEEGEPSPCIHVEYLLLEEVEICGLTGTGGGGFIWSLYRFEDDLEDCRADGGV